MECIYELNKMRSVYIFVMLERFIKCSSNIVIDTKSLGFESSWHIYLKISRSTNRSNICEVANDNHRRPVLNVISSYRLLIEAKENGWDGKKPEGVEVKRIVQQRNDDHPWNVGYK